MIKDKWKQCLLLCLFAIGSVFLYFYLPPIKSIQAIDQVHEEASKQRFDMLSFAWIIGLIGGCIGLTLTYVSWRKYQAELKNKSKRKQIDNRR